MRLFVHQLRGEQRLFWRSRELAFFTFLFPILLLVLLGSVYGDDRIKKEHNVKASAYLLAGILGYGVAATAFAGSRSCSSSAARTASSSAFARRRFRRGRTSPR